VWSFGVTVWEIFSKGAQPYTGLNNQEVRIAVIAGQRLSQPKACPFSLWQTIQGCFSATTQFRPTFEVLHASIVAQLRTTQVTTSTKLVCDDGTKDLTKRRVCVQCGREYFEDENTDNSCSFHWAGNPDSTGTYRCCSHTDNYPCTRNKHHSVHHCDFSYATFHDWAVAKAMGSQQLWLELAVSDFE
jgi:hypothetical protein